MVPPGSCLVDANVVPVGQSAVTAFVCGQHDYLCHLAGPSEYRSHSSLTIGIGVTELVIEENRHSVRLVDEHCRSELDQYQELFFCSAG